MKVRTYSVLARAVEEGVAYGYMRAYKYTETPDEHQIKDAITDAVLSAIAEVFTFEDDQVEYLQESKTVL